MVVRVYALEKEGGVMYSGLGMGVALVDTAFFDRAAIAVSARSAAARFITQ